MVAVSLYSGFFPLQARCSLKLLLARFWACVVWAVDMADTINKILSRRPFHLRGWQQLVGMTPLPPSVHVSGFMHSDEPDQAREQPA